MHLSLLQSCTCCRCYKVLFRDCSSAFLCICRCFSVLIESSCSSAIKCDCYCAIKSMCVQDMVCTPLAVCTASGGRDSSSVSSSWCSARVLVRVTCGGCVGASVRHLLCRTASASRSLTVLSPGCVFCRVCASSRAHCCRRRFNRARCRLFGFPRRVFVLGAGVCLYLSLSPLFGRASLLHAFSRVFLAGFLSLIWLVCSRFSSAYADLARVISGLSRLCTLRICCRIPSSPPQ